MLDQYLTLTQRGAEAGSQVKEAQKTLNAKVAAKYAKLNVDEVKTLVVDDKWLASLAAAVHGELERLSQALTSRVRQLAERYATPLPKLADALHSLGALVDAHLEKMGFVWN
jgi:type I restriction enzyme M protein